MLLVTLGWTGRHGHVLAVGSPGRTRAWPPACHPAGPRRPEVLLVLRRRCPSLPAGLYFALNLPVGIQGIFHLQGQTGAGSTSLRGGRSTFCWVLLADHGSCRRIQQQTLSVKQKPTGNHRQRRLWARMMDACSLIIF